MELIHVESTFYFIKIHLITHFRDHINQFGNTLMYSGVFGELAYNEQMKKGWRPSNKIDATCQILNSYGPPHAILMRLLNLEFPRDAGLEIAAEALDDLEITRTSQQLPSSRRVLKGLPDDIRDVMISAVYAIYS